MALRVDTDQLVRTLQRTITGLVADNGPDLTARQLAVFLTCYLKEGPHTVRGLAALLKVPKPSISRALDRLVQWDLARRKPDPADRRSITVERSAKGMAFLRVTRDLMAKSAENP